MNKYEREREVQNSVPEKHCVCCAVDRAGSGRPFQPFVLIGLGQRETDEGKIEIYACPTCDGEEIIELAARR